MKNSDFNKLSEALVLLDGIETDIEIGRYYLHYGVEYLKKLLQVEIERRENENEKG